VGIDAILERFLLRLLSQFSVALGGYSSSSAKASILLIIYRIHCVDETVESNKHGH